MGNNSAGAGCGCIFFSFFLVLGSVGVFFIGSEALEQSAVESWDRVTCQVVDMTLPDKPPYDLKLTYEYEYEGETYSSNAVKRNQEKYIFDDYNELMKKYHELSETESATCYVNPENPEESALMTESVWFAFFIIIPLIFAVIGLGGIIFSLKSLTGKKQEKKSEPLSERGASKNVTIVGRLAGVMFGGVFFLAGLGFLFPFFILPVTRISGSSSWEEVPCKVIHSRVQSHRSDDGTTYSIDILYEYEIEGKIYRSNAYDFIDVSSSGSSGKREIVRQHPRGKQTVCYVNPDDPYEAVLSREYSWVLLFGLIPIIFVLVGLGIILASIFGKSKKSKSKSIQSVGTTPRRFSAGRTSGVSPSTRTGTEYVPAYEKSNQPVELDAHTSRWGKVFGLLFFAVFWNGITSIFVGFAVKSWMDGNPEWFLTIFITPFVIVGLVVILLFIKEVIGLFNPKPVVTVNSNTLSPGETLDVAWDIKGRTSRIRKLTFTFEGREEATYRQGTDTRTDDNTFATYQIYETTNEFDMQAGAASIVIPENAIHTLHAHSNKILWMIKVHGDIPRWPDIEFEYEIFITPKPLKS